MNYSEKSEVYFRASHQFPGNPQKAWKWLSQYEERSEQESLLPESTRRKGTSGFSWVDSMYPKCLRKLRYPPPFLFSQGTYFPGIPRVGIVGTRDADSYTQSVAFQLGLFLGKAGVVVVSGGARGVDTSAHKGMLASGGKGCLVLAGGLDHPSPKPTRTLCQDIVNGGGMVCSENPDSIRPLRHFFLGRNRLIAALSDILVVVGARKRSGSLSTAREALDLSHPVYAVPGDLTYALSEGGNGLIQRGEASLLTHPRELLDHFPGYSFACDPWPKSSYKREVQAPKLWDPSSKVSDSVLPSGVEGRLILEWATGQSIGAMEVSQRTETSLGHATALLEHLCLEGHMQRIPGNRFVRRQ